MDGAGVPETMHSTLKRADGKDVERIKKRGSLVPGYRVNFRSELFSVEYQHCMLSLQDEVLAQFLH